MKKLVVGILAHVDAGKTTLSEAMLYTSGTLRKLGRVDHGDAFLDTDVQERERGITIFSKQAMLSVGDTQITLLDTPGHVDFSAEMERTLQVMDCAILVISGKDGVQGHTRTLWKLLERYNVPTFLFVNKMDLAGANREKLMEEFSRLLNSGCVDFGDNAQRNESAAMCDEKALEEFLETGTLTQKRLAALIAQRKLFPCWFGSALKLDGVEAFLTGLTSYAEPPKYPPEFGARVFKISRDSKNTRLTWMKITGGVLRAKVQLSGGEDETRWEEKADQLRSYSGVKFQPLEEAGAGEVVAVTGLTHTYPGQGLGFEEEAQGALLAPVLNYRMILPENAAPHTVLPKLRQLEEEDPMLRILWNERLKEIHVQLMGQVQLEVLQRLIADRFDLRVTFGAGNIVYKETIADRVEGVGHFEPLRHYAEVHLLLEPGERGSGIRITSALSTDDLELNWQRLVFTHLLEKNHLGVLTGSPVTDIRITLVAGRAHVKHTEGGDFREATYRAVRHGLMQAQSVLLEPFYNFRITLPPDCAGRVMTDVQTMGGVTHEPEIDGDMTVLTGYAPVAGLQNYGQEIAAYTRGLGQMSYSLRGYEPCRNAEEVTDSIGYEAERDIENTADSVFCAHGAGFTVKWDRVREYMHLDSGLRLGMEMPPQKEKPVGSAAHTVCSGSLEQEQELRAIFERTYGKVERRDFQPPKPAAAETEKVRLKEQPAGPEYLLVDGYNIIFAWEDLKELARQNIASARDVLEDILSNYQAFRGCVLILVFDAYKVKGNPGSIEKHNGIYVVYTREAETADSYIEKTTYQLARGRRVRVATSDNLEQMIILGHGAFVLSAEVLRKEVAATQVQINQLIAEHSFRSRENWKVENTAKVTKE